MEKLNELISLCKNSVSIDINNHRDYYMSVLEYIGNDIEDIDESVLNTMVELDTTISIQFYPDTPIGSYTVYHYDLETAVDKCLNILKQ